MQLSSMTLCELIPTDTVNNVGLVGVIVGHDYCLTLDTLQFCIVVS